MSRGVKSLELEPASKMSPMMKKSDSDSDSDSDGSSEVIVRL